MAHDREPLRGEPAVRRRVRRERERHLDPLVVLDLLERLAAHLVDRVREDGVLLDVEVEIGDPRRLDEPFDRGRQRRGVAALALDVRAVGAAERCLEVSARGDECAHVGHVLFDVLRRVAPAVREDERDRDLVQARLGLKVGETGEGVAAAAPDPRGEVGGVVDRVIVRATVSRHPRVASPFCWGRGRRGGSPEASWPLAGGAEAASSPLAGCCEPPASSPDSTWRRPIPTRRPRAQEREPPSRPRASRGPETGVRMGSRGVGESSALFLRTAHLSRSVPGGGVAPATCGERIRREFGGGSSVHRDARA